MKEIWKPIEGFEELYAISNLARVKSFYANKIRILKLNITKGGYLTVGLCKDGKNKTHYVHHLVWDHFGDCPRNGHKQLVDHRDEDKLNPRIDNLQLLTNRQNSIKYCRTQKYSLVASMKK